MCFVEFWLCCGFGLLICGFDLGCLFVVGFGFGLVLTCGFVVLFASLLRCLFALDTWVLHGCLFVLVVVGLCLLLWVSLCIVCGLLYMNLCCFVFCLV